jgi:integrase
LYCWHLDFERGVIRVRDQVDRIGTRQPLKTEKGRRDVVLQPSLARLLREHRLASAHSQDDDYIFCRRDGRPMHPDVVRVCGLRRAVATAGLDAHGRPRLRFHDLRHIYASLLIAQGVDVA